MIHKSLPGIDFEAVVVYCYIHDGRFLLLQKRLNHEYYPGLWGFPAGRIKPGENLIKAGERVVFEETGNETKGYVIDIELAPSPTVHHNLLANDVVYFLTHVLFCSKPLDKIEFNNDENRDFALTPYFDIVAEKFSTLFRTLMKILCAQLRSCEIWHEKNPGNAGAFIF